MSRAPSDAETQLPTPLLDIECVVAEPLKFKRKLRIGEDAYKLLRLKNKVQSVWDVGGVAATGASVAASSAVASTFFSGGFLSMIGLGAATTPVGWVLAAAAVSGGAYYGVTRLVRGRAGALVETIPRFISTPIDLLGMQLLDLMGALALRVADIDGTVSSEERRTIERHFVEEWGYDGAYVAQALDLLQAGDDPRRVREIAKTLAEFQAANPDCNGEAMQSELLSFLREIAEADGVLDEREELAVEAVATLFRQERAETFHRLRRTLAKSAGTATGSLKQAGATALTSSKDLGGTALSAMKAALKNRH